jgi:serine/threonine protein phosphatase PrpC
MNQAGWPLWSSEHPEVVAQAQCPHCGQPIAADAAFCEACGATLTPSEPLSRPVAPSEHSTQTRRLGTRASQLNNCPACGGTIDADGYCQTCGAKAPSARDHYTESPSPWVGGVCDRGMRHPRNEDALALWADEDRAVLVVCDGVSTSVDSDAAAMVAAKTVRDVLVSCLQNRGEDEDPATVLRQAFVDAAETANTTVAAGTAVDTPNAASATLAAAVVLDGAVHYANLGDSRVYFLGAESSVLLSVDDSVAQAFIAQGMERAEAESLPRAHAITKWLGRDAVDIVPTVGVHQITEPGWVVVCSDGLWNYASSPAELATQLKVAGAAMSDPITVAQHLVQWANRAGGRDNITVALAHCPASAGATTLEAVRPASSTQIEEQPEHG